MIDWSAQHCGVHQAPHDEAARLMPDLAHRFILPPKKDQEPASPPESSRARVATCDRCRAPRAIGRYCFRHCNSSRAAPWVLSSEGQQLVAYPATESTIERRRSRPLTRHAALRLILAGVITRAVFLHRGRKRLLRYLERHGIRAVHVEGGKLVQVYRFGFDTPCELQVTRCLVEVRCALTAQTDQTTD